MDPVPLVSVGRELSRYGLFLDVLNVFEPRSPGFSFRYQF